MKKVAQYIYTIRYLKPIQIFGRIWFLLQTPSVRSAPAPTVRKPAGEWIQPPLKTPSLLSPSRFRFLNETHDLLSVAGWNNPDWEKLWLYHLHYFDNLNADGTAQRVDWHTAIIGRWIAENPPYRGNGWELRRAVSRPLNFCPSCHCEARSGEAISWFIEWL